MDKLTIMAVGVCVVCPIVAVVCHIIGNILDSLIPHLIKYIVLIIMIILFCIAVHELQVESVVNTQKLLEERRIAEEQEPHYYHID